MTAEVDNQKSRITHPPNPGFNQNVRIFHPSGMQFNTKIEEIVWLSGCYVGKMKAPYPWPEVGNTIQEAIGDSWDAKFLEGIWSYFNQVQGRI